jgi:hypothetical protein
VVLHNIGRTAHGVYGAEQSVKQGFEMLGPQRGQMNQLLSIVLGPLRREVIAAI